MSRQVAPDGSGANSRPKVNLKSPVLLLRVVVTVTILAMLFWWLPVDLIVAGIVAVPLWVWLVCLTGFAFGHAVAAMKWGYLLRSAGVIADHWLLLRAHAAGLFANLCLPSIVGGDVIRAAMVIKAKGKPAEAAIASFVDRLIDTLVLVIIAIVSMLLLPESIVQNASESFKHVPLIVGVCLSFLLSVVALVAVIAVVPERHFPIKVRGIAKKVQGAIRAMCAAPVASIIAFFLSCVIQCGFILLNILLAGAVGISVHPLVWFAAWPLAKLIALVPISLGGIGVRDAALMSLLVPFGVSASTAVAQSLSWQAVLWATGLIAGAVIAVTTYRSRVNATLGNQENQFD